MYEPPTHLRPYRYLDRYTAAINAGWTEHDLDQHLARATARAESKAYLQAVIDSARSEVPPETTTTPHETTTQPQAIRTARIDGHPSAGRTIQPHRYESADAYCVHCQLPAANRAHLP